MQFLVHIKPLPEPAADQVTVTWELVKADGEVVCQGPHTFHSEKEARSQIASAKKSMRATQRCKVVTVDE